VVNLPDSPSRDTLLANITTTWAQQDPAGLLTWAGTNLTGPAYDSTALAAMKQMATSDPASAAAYMAQNPDSNLASQIIPTLAYQWGQQNAQAALVWAQSLPTDNPTQRNAALSGVFNSWTFSDPASAATYLQQNFATDPVYGTLVSQVVGTWGASNPQAVLTWAENLPQSDAQNSAISTAITSLARVDPQTAWTDAQQLSGSAQVSVLSTWATQQPAQAAAALQSLSPGNNLDTATADVAESWLNQDPNAASQWIDTLPQGPARDAAVNQLVSSVGKNDPASAFNWAVTLSDPTTRNTQVVALATQWSSQNPAAAAAAAQNALGNLPGLTSAQQTALQNVAAKASTP
jgi:hypothetical protein